MFPILLHIEIGHVTSFVQWTVGRVTNVKTAPALNFLILRLCFGEGSAKASEKKLLDIRNLGRETIPWKGTHEIGL